MKHNDGRWLVQLTKFLLVGVANTLVGLGTIWLLIGLAGWNDAPANFAGYVVGLACSFTLNRAWTFRDVGQVLPAMTRFLLVFGVAYAANLAAMFWLRDTIGLNRYWAHALATVPYTALFFIGSRLFVFVRPRQPKAIIDPNAS